MNISMKGNNVAGSSITINGTPYSGNNISISNGKVVVNGVVQEQTLSYNITVNVIGDVETLDTISGDVYIQGNVGNLKTTSGDVQCKDVAANVQTVSGDVRASKITGNVKTVSGDIN
jgi:glutamate synthase domain-containing protein 3